MTTDYVEQINLAIEDITFLKNLKKDVDPASCMSVSVRLGVPQDRRNVDDDELVRPWRTMSFGASDGTTADMERLINMLIEDRLVSLKRWRSAAADQVLELAKANEAAQKVLGNHS